VSGEAASEAAAARPRVQTQSAQRPQQRRQQQQASLTRGGARQGGKVVSGGGHGLGSKRELELRASQTIWNLRLSQVPLCCNCGACGA
jgi:hypothetical protein